MRMPSDQSIDDVTARLATSSPYRFVFEPLAYWAETTPDRIALRGTGVEWTYAQIEARTNQIARLLRQRDVCRGDRVAFVLPRGPRTILLLIGILKAGAAYVPIASDSPPTRIAHCIEDAEPTLVVTEGASLCDLPHATLAELANPGEEVDAGPFEIDRDESDLAYVIFTSGTTGRPKGVPITHRSLWNFVEGDQRACIRLEPDDRVFQGFSPASDGHHEEVWPTFLAGATLVVATNAEVYSGDELGQFLVRNEATVISCAPTLLSTVERDVPSLRRILFGAENCPMSLVRRWWRPGREILNTYGPTEATVGTTFSLCEPDKTITIGRPLPNYECYVLDESLNVVADGCEGELAIAGVGVTSGYLNRPDATAEKFLPNPFGSEERGNSTLYRTGDRVTRDSEGNLVWLGRIDGQVKIRGYRIELSEIEGHVLALPQIQSVAVVARAIDEQESQLVALVVAREGFDLSLNAMVDGLRDSLPAHMIPPVFEVVPRIPILPSGKVDRRGCQTLRGHQLRMERELVPPRTDTESMVLTVWKSLFGTDDVSCADNFFTDLGGYSLMASRFISVIRNEHGHPGVSVLDIYENPTVRSFAACLDGRAQAAEDESGFVPVPPGRYNLARLVQALGVLVLFGIQGAFWLGPILGAIYYSNVGISDFKSLVMGLVLHAVSVPVLLLLAIGAKWLVGGKFKEGAYPIWSGTFLRWWFVHRMLAIAPNAYLTGTPLAALYLRLLGAKVGKNCTFESLDVDCPDLIEIGDDCSFENSSWVRASEVTNGQLVIRPIKIGSGCIVGVRSGVAGGSVLELGSALQDLSCAAPGTVVPSHEEWCGSPAAKSEHSRLPRYEPAAQPSQRRLALYGAAQCLLMIPISLLDSLPFMTVAFTLYNSCEGFGDYLSEPIFAFALVAIACVQAILVKRTVIGRLKPGTFGSQSIYALRKWFTDKHLELMTNIIVPIYDSLFARPLVLALGMKCGPRCEIALPRRMPYDLVEMGEESFLASEVSVGMPIRRNGMMRLERTVFGKRSFLGNDSVVPQGVHFPEESLLGVLSVCPSTGVMGESHDQAWLGSPAFRMPSRQVVGQFDVRQTYKPTRKLYAQRLAHETLRILLPSLGSLAVLSVMIEGFVAIWNASSLRIAILTIPLLYALGAFIGAVLCKAAKWALVGRYRPTVQPLWSQFVWKAETYSAVLHDFGVPLFVIPLVGTPFLNAFMRFLGAKIGKRVFINSTDWTETDLIQIGDDTSINENAPLQAHLFEDRVMKVGAIKIGERCSIGNFSVVLCESEIKSDAHVGHLSLVMKGETIPSNTFWYGCPAQVGKALPR